MTVRIVLQARTTSRRLPAKSLLSVAGLPLAVMCGRRLARGGIDLVLATSADRSDDELAATTASAGLGLFRGPLDDVAARFLAATADLADDDILVRATADNPVPDHDVVTAMLADFAASGAPYLGRLSYRNAPYGGLVEVVRLGALRVAAAGGFDREAIEHVTSRLAAGVPTAIANPDRFDIGLGELRVTVDTLNDYLIAAAAFRTFPDPVAVPWHDAAAVMHMIRERA